MKRSLSEEDDKPYEGNKKVDSTYRAPERRRKRQARVVEARNEPSPHNSETVYRHNTLSNRNVHIDFGTSKAAISWADVPSSQTDPANVAINDVTIDNNLWRIPTLVAIEPNNGNARKSATMVFGPDVEKKLARRQIDAKYVFTRIKQSSVFVDPNSTSEQMSKEQKDELKVLQQSHEETLKHVRRFDRIVARFPMDENDEQIQLQTMQDVVKCFLKYLLQKAKYKLRETVHLNSKDFETAFSRDWRVGASVPDLWSPETRNDFYSLLVSVDEPGHAFSLSNGAGFPEKVQLTSESKSASAMLLKTRLSEALKLPRASRDQTLKRLQKTTFINVDIGAGTTDIGSLRLQISGIDGGLENSEAITSRLVSVIDSRSCRDGGDRVNESLKRRLTKIFGNRFDEIISHALGGQRMSKNTFLNYFDLRMEEVKAGFEKSRPGALRDITYAGPGNLPAREFRTKDGIVKMFSTGISIPSALLAICFDEQLDDILSPDGILDSHVASTRVAVGSDMYVEIMLSGGGSHAPYVCDRFKKKYESENIPVMLQGNHDRSLVAQGGVLALMDPDLCKQHVAVESYGLKIAAAYNERNYVHQSRRVEKAEPEYPDTVPMLYDSIEWLSRLGDRSSENLRSLEWGYSIDLGKISHPKEFKDSLDLRCTIYKTADPFVGQQNGWNVHNTPEIQQAGELHLPITRRNAREIGITDATHDGGFLRTEDGRWVLDFDIRLTHYWSGMIHRFKIEIPEKGIFEYDGSIFEREVRLQGRTIHGAFIGDHNEEIV